MTSKPLILLAAALTAGVVSYSPAAEAGGGVRLSFGGPLGSFVARPTQGYAPSYGNPGCNKPSYASARTHYSKPAAKKPVSVASRRHDDDDDMPSKPKRKLEVAKSEKSETRDSAASSETSSSVKQVATNSVPLTPATPAASTTSAPQVLKLDSKAAETPAATAAKPEAGAEAAAKQPTVAAAETTGTPGATLVTAASTVTDTPPKPEAQPDKKADPKPAKPAKTVEKKSDCRRFIPSAGITISVRCGD